MSSPPTLAAVAEDYSDFHVSVEAHAPIKRDDQSFIASRLMKRVSTNRDLKKILSIVKSKDREKSDDKRSQSSGKASTKSNRGDIRNGSNSESWEQPLVEKDVKTAGHSKSMKESMTHQDGKSGQGSTQAKDHRSSVSLQGLRRKISSRIGIKQSSRTEDSVKKSVLSNKGTVEAQLEKPLAGETFAVNLGNGKSEQKSGFKLKHSNSNVLKSHARLGQSNAEKLLLESSPVSERAHGKFLDQDDDVMKKSPEDGSSSGNEKGIRNLYSSRLAKTMSSLGKFFE